MSVMLVSEHKRILRGLRNRNLFLHGVWVLVLVSLCIWPYLLKLEHDLVAEAYSVVKTEYDTILLRHDLLRLLRTKSMSVGQALDVVDVIMSQKAVPVPLVMAVISQESEFRVDAVSHKGAKGLMQLLPATFREYSSLKDRHVFTPHENVRAGVNYLGELFNRFGRWENALRAYYAGPSQAHNRAYDWYAKAVIVKAERFGEQIGYQTWQ